MKYKTGILKWAVALLILLVFSAQSVQSVAFAQTQDQLPVTVSSFDPLPAGAGSQALPWRSPESSVVLPDTLTGTDSQGEAISISGVTWAPDKPFDSRLIATYLYTAQIPADYTLATGVSAPQISVGIKPVPQTVTGVQYSRVKTAGRALQDQITVSPAYSCTVFLQMKSGGKWVTKASFQTKDLPSQTLTLTYPAAWYRQPVSYWRIRIPAREGVSAYTGAAIHVTAKRVFQNPRNYFQIHQAIVIRQSGGYTLKMGYMGPKVAKVQKKLGLGGGAYYTASVKNRVKAFQRKRHLKATGNVNLATWKRMGFSKASWYGLGKYTSPVRVTMASTKKQCIAAMIANARRYLGDKFVVGSSNKPGVGVDCSGLVMQGLYAGGINPLPSSCVRHAHPGYEYESAKLWASNKLMHVKYAQRQRGDLIFYAGRGGGVMHVAIYLGNNQVIESWPPKVMIQPIKNSQRSRIAGVARPFV